MARGLHEALDSFHCYSCDKRLGWTSQGEAKRMNSRSRLFCDMCKDTPGSLTERMEEVLAALAALRDSGERASVSAAAKRIGMSGSRAQQIVTAIRARGQGDLVDAAMGKVSATPSTPAVQSFPSTQEPARPVAAVQFANPDGSPADPPIFLDPAASGANEFA